MNVFLRIIFIWFSFFIVAIHFSLPFYRSSIAMYSFLSFSSFVSHVLHTITAFPLRHQWWFWYCCCYCCCCSLMRTHIQLLYNLLDILCAACKRSTSRKLEIQSMNIFTHSLTALVVFTRSLALSTAHSVSFFFLHSSLDH